MLAGPHQLRTAVLRTYSVFLLDSKRNGSAAVDANDQANTNAEAPPRRVHNADLLEMLLKRSLLDDNAFTRLAGAQVRTIRAQPDAVGCKFTCCVLLLEQPSLTCKAGLRSSDSIQAGSMSRVCTGNRASA
jgi:hypothetical protein